MYKIGDQVLFYDGEEILTGKIWIIKRHWMRKCYLIEYTGHTVTVWILEKNIIEIADEKRMRIKFSLVKKQKAFLNY